MSSGAKDFLGMSRALSLGGVQHQRSGLAACRVDQHQGQAQCWQRGGGTLDRRHQGHGACGQRRDPGLGRLVTAIDLQVQSDAERRHRTHMRHRATGDR